MSRRATSRPLVPRRGSVGRFVVSGGAARAGFGDVAEFRCTYRLQLSAEFGFRAAREVALPYIRDLGASHLYLSPSLQARKGSTHGYDVVDPTRISDELGGEDELRALCDAAQEAGLGVLLDIVPNHMATSETEN